MVGLLGNSLPPGLAGFVTQRQLAGQEQNQQLGQIQGLLGMQTAQMQQGLLGQQLAEKQRKQAEIESFANTLPPDKRQAFMIDPTGYINRMNEVKIAAAGSSVLDGFGNVRQTLPTAPRDAPQFKIGDTRKFRVGRQEITQEFTPNGWVELGKGDIDRPPSFNIAAPVTVTEVIRNGKVVKIDARTGREIGDAPTQLDKKGPKTDIDKTMDVYVAASNGLISGLSGASSGPLVGRIPAFTTDAQIAEGGVAAMAPVLKQIFRVAGEGTFTDKDQELLLNMVPTRKDTPAARKEKIQNIDNIVAAKLGIPIPEREWADKTKPITPARRASDSEPPPGAVREKK